MLSNEIKVRVKYGETDKMGYAYYGCYPLYYEMGRTELLRSHGLIYKELEDTGILLPVVNLKIEYLAPALYDELLTIRTVIKEKPSVKVTFHYEIYNEAGILINQAVTDLVFTNALTRKPCKPPKSFIDVVNKFFDSNLD